MDGEKDKSGEHLITTELGMLTLAGKGYLSI